MFIFETRLESVEREQEEQRKREEDYKRKDQAYKQRQVELLELQTEIFEKQAALHRQLSNLTFGLVVIGALALAASFWQSWQTQRSADAAKEGADAAAKAAKAAENTLESGREAFVRTLGQMQRQSAAAEINAAATKQTANVAAAALQNSSNAFRLEMRPYVTVSNLQLKELPREGVSPQVLMDIQNTGRTPGLRLRISRDYRLQDSLPCEVPRLEFPADASMAGIGAGSTIGPIITSSPGTINKKDAELIASGKKFICHFGLIRYVDVFGDEHETESCSFWSPEPIEQPLLTACAHYNEVR